MSIQEDQIAAVRTAFLTRLLADRAMGRERCLVDYQALYPGFETDIAEEWAELEAEPQTGGVAAGGDFERYERRGELGRGGMGVVYRVHDRLLGRDCAMKVLRTGVPLKAAARFRDEIRLVAGLNHPGIVAVHDLGEDDAGRPFFTMPLVDGQSLREVIDGRSDSSGGSSLPQLVELLRRVCQAVAYAHARGIVHRDLKPANVMVGAFGEVFVLDWGLASARSTAGLAGPDDPLRTLSGEVSGTPAYMAPEQARGAVDEVGPGTDIYALGAMLRHMITGAPPFHEAGAGPSASTVVARLARGDGLAPLAAGAAPAALASICERAMAHEPADRYRGVTALEEDLAAFLESRVVQAHRSGALAELRAWVGRNRGMAAALLLVFVSVAAGLAVALSLQAAADANARQSDRNAARAQANFELAYQAVDDLLTEIGSDTLTDAGSVEDLRRSLLTKALAYYEELLARRSDEPRVARETIAAAQRAALIHWELGAFDAAQQAGERALELLDRGVVVAPASRGQARLLRAKVMQVLGNVQAERGELGAAEQTFAAIVELIGAHEEDVEAQTLAATASYNLALARYRREQYEAGLTALQEALRLREALWTSAPDELAHALRLGSAVGLQGALRNKLGQREAMRTSLLRAVAVYEAAVRTHPGARRALEGLGLACNNAGILLAPDEGESLLRRAYDIRSDLVERHPDHPRLRNVLGSTLHNLSRLEAGRRRYTAAVDAAFAAVETQQECLRRWPEFEPARRSLRRHVRQCAKVVRAAGDPTRIAACGELRAELAEDVGTAQQLLVHYYADAAAKALPTDRDAALDWARRAAEAAERAIQQGVPSATLFEHPWVQPVADLAPLRALRDGG